MVFFKKKFDHTKPTTYEAIGISKEKYHELTNELKRIILAGCTSTVKSQIIEKIYNIIKQHNEIELAVIVFKTFDYLVDAAFSSFIEEKLKKNNGKGTQKKSKKSAKKDSKK